MHWTMVGSRVCMCALGACVQRRSSEQRRKKVSFSFNVYLRIRMWTNNELLIKSYDEQNERTTYVHIMRLAFVYIRLARRKKASICLRKREIGMFPSPSFFITVMLIAGGVRKEIFAELTLTMAIEPSFLFSEKKISGSVLIYNACCLSEKTVHVWKTI